MYFNSGGQEELDTNTPQGIYSVLREIIEVQAKPTCNERVPEEVGDGKRLLSVQRTISTFTGGGDVCLGSQKIGRQNM